MKTVEAVEHYGNKAAVARALGISPAAITKWGEFPPDEKQIALQRETSGQLKAETEVVEKYRAIADALFGTATA